MATQATHGGGQTLDQGPPINVRVTVSKDPDGTIVYDHDWNVSGGPVKKGKIDVPKDTPPTDIKFHLTDRTGLNLSFYPAPADAFYVGFYPNCPTSAGNAGEFDLNDPPSSSSNNLLTVLDTNRTACDLKYVLRFDGDSYTDPNGTYPPFVYDPELRNGGGGSL